MPEKPSDMHASQDVDALLAEAEMLGLEFRRAAQLGQGQAQSQANNPGQSQPQTQLQTQPQTQDMAGGDHVVFRFTSGLSPGQLEKLGKQMRLDSWILHPLAADSYALIRRLQRKIDDLSHAAGHDDLTGLARRELFERTLQTEVERAWRGSQTLSLAMLDIDDFKQINDDYGHPHGDQVLQAVAEVLRTHTRLADLGARMGGEEFALLMPSTSQARAAILLQRIMNAIRELRFPAHSSQEESRVTISVGLACYKGYTPPHPEELLEIADQALYEAKHAGKDRLIAAPIKDIAPQASARTLVDTAEKQFLFQTQPN
jgi:diguanylate cyclase (GGDEF)-like protein